MVPLHRPSSAGCMTSTALFPVTSPALGEILIEQGDTSHIGIAEAPNLSDESKLELAGNIVQLHRGVAQRPA